MTTRRVTRRQVLKGAAALGAVSVAAACAPTATGPAGATQGAALTTPPDREIVLAYTADLDTLDPALIRGPNEHENALHMYNGLVRYAYNANSVQVEPDLAESWQV